MWIQLLVPQEDNMSNYVFVEWWINKKIESLHNYCKKWAFIRSISIFGTRHLHYNLRKKQKVLITKWEECKRIKYTFSFIKLPVLCLITSFDIHKWQIHIILPKVPRHQCTRGSLNWKRYSPARLWWPGRGRVHPGLWTVTSERCSDWNSGSSCHRPSMTSSQIFGAVPQGFGDVWMGCSTSLSSVNKMLIFSQFCTNACFPYNWYIVTLYIRSFGVAQTRHRCLGLGLYLIHVL